MKTLFKKCLKAEYIHTDAGGDYAIEYENGVIYLLFEKSNGDTDWKNNFDFPAKPYKHMSKTWLCHRGFLRVWKSMRDQIEAEVARIMSEEKVRAIVCVGYSHGAALALFATEDMMYLYGGKVLVCGYGYGCPRVVWGFLPRSVKQRLRRFTAVRNVPDLVTHVPPAIFGFRHIQLRRVGKLGKYGPIKAHRAMAYLAELEDDEG